MKDIIAQNPCLIYGVIGGICGWVLSVLITSPRFRHVRSGYWSRSGGMPSAKGCLVNLILIAGGVLVGLVIANTGGGNCFN